MRPLVLLCVWLALIGLVGFVMVAFRLVNDYALDEVSFVGLMCLVLALFGYVVLLPMVSRAERILREIKQERQDS